MSIWQSGLLIAVTAAQLGQSGVYLAAGNWRLAVVLFGYAVSGAGLILVAQRGG